MYIGLLTVWSIGEYMIADFCLLRYQIPPFSIIGGETSLLHRKAPLAVWPRIHRLISCREYIELLATPSLVLYNPKDMQEGINAP